MASSPNPRRPLTKAERADLSRLVGRAWFSPPNDWNPAGTITWVLSLGGPGAYCLNCRWADADRLAFMDGGKRKARTFLDDLARGAKGAPLVEVTAPQVGDVIAWVGVFGRACTYRVESVAPFDRSLITAARPTYVPLPLDPAPDAE